MIWPLLFQWYLRLFILLGKIAPYPFVGNNFLDGQSCKFAPHYIRWIYGQTWPCGFWGQAQHGDAKDIGKWLLFPCSVVIWFVPQQRIGDAAKRSQPSKERVRNHRKRFLTNEMTNAHTDVRMYRRTMPLVPFRASVIARRNQFASRIAVRRICWRPKRHQHYSKRFANESQHGSPAGEAKNLEPLWQSLICFLFHLIPQNPCLDIERTEKLPMSWMIEQHSTIKIIIKILRSPINLWPSKVQTSLSAGPQQHPLPGVPESSWPRSHLVLPESKHQTHSEPWLQKEV